MGALHCARRLGLAAALGATLSIALAACRGGGGSDADDEDDDDETGEPPAPPAELVAAVGLRRLSRYELDNSLRDLFGDNTRPAQQFLPEDPRTPFDNDYAQQIVSAPLVEGLEMLATDVAERLVADPERRDAVVGCAPNEVGDDACMRELVTRVGRLALRRALDDAEVDDLVALGLDNAARHDDFFAGVQAVVRALVQDPELVYRVEIGEPVDDEPGVFRLSSYELASRMSFFLWGTTPDDALLDAAEAGELDDEDGVREIAETMLADPRARDHLDRFHALWLGYAELPHDPDLTNAMRRESAALVQRVVFDERESWVSLFTAEETWLDATLAEHYGLSAPDGPDGEAGWVAYGDDPRRGLLSHGSFLSVASNVADTSPTKRGKLVREQLMCQVVPPPPPNVMADEPPDASVAECKEDRYAVHRQGSCAGCHEQMDPIGFGLERYDRAGRYREHDEGAPECAIAGEGELTGVGEFAGPAELGALLADDPALPACAAQQLYRFALGREVGPEDEDFLAAIVEAFAADEHRFDALLVAVVAHPAFAHRREESDG